MKPGAGYLRKFWQSPCQTIMKWEEVNSHIKARNHRAKCSNTIPASQLWRQVSLCEFGASLVYRWPRASQWVCVSKRMGTTTSLQSLQSKALPRLLPTIYAYTFKNVHEMNNFIETTNCQNHGEITVANIVLCAVCLGKFRIKLLGFVI